MHQSSRNKMSMFATMCSSVFCKNEKISLLDVGGVGNSYRKIFEDVFSNINYVTLNVKLGDTWSEERCSIMVNDAYNWQEIPDEHFDIVISGQVFEHIEYFWITVLEMRRILKKEGYVCIIAPSHWREHRHPYDTYRFYTDGMNAICKFAGLDILYSGADHPINHTYVNMKGDAYVVAKKHSSSLEIEDKYKLVRKFCHDIIPSHSSYELSRNKKVIQSSHSKKWEYARGIGNSYSIVSNNFTGSYAIHTQNEDCPFFIIDIEKSCFVDNVRLFNRKGMEKRALDIDILCSDDMIKWHLIYSKTGYFGGIYDANPFICSINKVTRYIRIQKSSKGILHLDQVQVFGHIL